MMQVEVKVGTVVRVPSTPMIGVTSSDPSVISVVTGPQGYVASALKVGKARLSAGPFPDVGAFLDVNVTAS